MYGALLYGGRVVIAKGEHTKDPGRFVGNSLRHNASPFWNQTPAAFYNLIDIGDGAKRRIIWINTSGMLFSAAIN